MRQWEHLQQSVDELVKAYKTRGLRALWNKIFKVSKQIRELVLAVAEFESHELWVDFDTERSYRGLIRGRREPFIDSRLKAEIQDRPVYKCS